mgnify:FL=1
MSDLLKEAIADAKAVRETALANAKMALEEAFTPHLKSMLSAKLAEDDIEEDDNPFADKDEDEDEDMPEEGMHDSPRREDDDDEEEVDETSDESPRREDDDEEEVDESEIVEIDGVKYAPIVSEEEHEDEDEDDEDDMDESEDLDLEAVIKELEEELEESKEDEEDSVNEEEITEGDVEEEKVDEEIDLNEEDEEDLEEQSTSSGIGKGTGVKQPSASDEEDPGKGKVHESVEAIQSELNEYKEAVVFLKDKLHEVNILNAKLLYTNKLFKEYALSNDQKLKIVETFDRAQTTREIKLVYTTLAESFTGEKNVKKEVVKEFASKKSGGTAPSKKIISEENQVADRFRKLAGIL